MGTSTTPTILRALLVPDPRFGVDAHDSTNSVVTQAGPMPGVPEAQDDTEMVLEAVGTQAATTQLRIKTVRGGNPGPKAAQFLWKYEGEAASLWRGWDPPASLTGFEFVDRSTTANHWMRFHAISLSNGTITVACVKDEQKVIVWARNPTTGVWTEHEVYDRGSAYTYPPCPCLVELPSGRLLCFFWAEDSGNWNIRNYYSDDSGTTWTPAQKGCLEDDIDVTDYLPKRIRAAYHDGQICLVAWLRDVAATEDQIWQYASNDLGASLDWVSTLDGIDRAYPDIIAHDGRLILAYVSEDATTSSTYPPKWRSIGAAYESFDAAAGGVCQDDTDPMEWGTQAAGVFDEGEMSLYADEDGGVWVMGRDHASAENELSARVTYEDGDNWREVGGGPATSQGTSTWIGEDAGTYPKDFSLCMHRGRAFMAHKFAASPGTADSSFAAAWLGGYTTVCLAQEAWTGSPRPTSVTGFTVTWLPYDYPEDVGNWTASSTGTPSLTSSGMRLITGNPGTELRIYNNIVGSITEGVTVLAECKLVTNQCRVEVRWNDSAATEYEVAVIVTTTRIKLWDLVAGSEIGGVDTTAGTTGFVQLLIDCQDNNAVAYYRVVGASGDRKWTQVGTTSACSNAGAISAPGHRVRFGQFDDSESYWRMVCFSSDEWTGQHIYGQSNWNDLLGRAYMPSPVWVDAGTSIQAVDGPTYRNDDWHIDTRYEYPVTNIYPDAASSPRRGWRSTTDASAAEIVWTMGSAVTTTMGPLIGLYLGECNFGTAELYGKNALNVWIKLADLDLRAGVSLKWTRDDRIVRFDASGATSVPYHLPANILAGSRIVLGGVGQQETAYTRKIETNSAGRWQAGSTGLLSRILLESVTGSEAASGTAAEIWVKDCCGVVPLTATYKAFKLKIPVQSTAEGYFTIGSMVFGSVYPIGGYLMGYGWGRKLEWAYSSEQVEGRSGIRTVQALGPTRRAVEVAWVDGIETSGLTDTNPNWLLGWTGGSPIAVPADLPWTLPGLLENLEGSKTPVVYLASCGVPATSSTVISITDRTTMLYGRVVSETLQGDVVLGEERASELIRVGTCRIEEEV